MGYTTDFMGDWEVTPPFKPEHRDYLRAFASTRRMKRNPHILEGKPDPKRRAVNLPIGDEGCFYVGEEDDFGQGDTHGSVVNHNAPPRTQPGLWCQWKPLDDEGTRFGWDYGEKFYYYVEWLHYIVDNFLEPWGYKLNGTVEWSGEEPGDLGRIIVTNNTIQEQHGRVTYS